MMDKTAIRTLYRTARKTVDHRAERTESAANLLSSLPEWISSKRVMLYWACGSELSAEPLFHDALKNGKEIYLPAVIDSSGSMGVGKYDPSENLSRGVLGIPEPRLLDTVPDLDLVVVPGTAFDRSGGRVGQGKGYYDRFLQNCSAVTAGYCFAVQLSEIPVPTDEHDVSLDMVVTDREVIRC